MQGKGFPWWGWLVVFAAVAGGGMSLDWFARFGWVIVSNVAEGAIEFVDESNPNPQTPALPVGE